jgi:hypothetical protein
VYGTGQTSVIRYWPFTYAVLYGPTSPKGPPAGDLYLEKLEFFQQLFELEETSPVLHRQRMEVDFIRLIEEKREEN